MQMPDDLEAMREVQLHGGEVVLLDREDHRGGLTESCGQQTSTNAEALSTRVDTQAGQVYEVVVVTYEGIPNNLFPLKLRGKGNPALPQTKLLTHHSFPH